MQRFITMIALGMFLMQFLSVSSFCNDQQNWVKQELPAMLKLYQHLHSNPELSYQEKATAEKVVAELKAAGVETTANLGGHGVVGMIKNGNGPVVLWRCDLDALPVPEMTGLAYASKKKALDEQGTGVPVMHACGHDIHVTNMIAAAKYFSKFRNTWSGTLIVIGQPAEERGGGATAMLKAGLFEKFPKPHYAVALHVDSSLEAGKLGYRAGYAMANTDSVTITMHGRGGHGSAPQTTIDPVVMGAQLVLDLQTIVSREISPLEPAVITVGSIHAGTKHNIISDSCVLQLTVRSYTEEVRKHLLSGIRRKALAVSTSFKAKDPTIEIAEGTPSLFNDERLTERLLPVFGKVVGAENLVHADRSMGGEDFSQYGRAGVPICMFRLGSISPERMKEYQASGKPLPSLHSPLYYPDAELTLQTGILATIAVLEDLLAKP